MTDEKAELTSRLVHVALGETMMTSRLDSILLTQTAPKKTECSLLDTASMVVLDV